MGPFPSEEDGQHIGRPRVFLSRDLYAPPDSAIVVQAPSITRAPKGAPERRSVCRPSPVFGATVTGDFGRAFGGSCPDCSTGQPPVGRGMPTGKRSASNELEYRAHDDGEQLWRPLVAARHINP